MTTTLSEFWTNLVQAGLASPDDCKQIAARWSSSHDGQMLSDPIAVAKFMISEGELTEFQARALISKPPIPLRIGTFARSSDAPPPSPLSRWSEVRSLGDHAEGWLLQLDAKDVDLEIRKWLADHQRVVGQGLQPIRCSASAQTSMEIFIELPRGRCLYDVLRDHSKLSRRRAVEIAIQIANSLEMLHREGLSLGCVRADRVWIPESGEAILLREPPHDRSNVSSRGNGLSFDDLEIAEAYAAPELANQEIAHDALTDIYGAGCLLFRMIQGRLPFELQSPQTLMAAHAHETPEVLADAVSQGPAGDPCFRVIAFAMAKNREARLVSAEQFSTALQAVLPLLEQDPGSVEAKPEPATANVPKKTKSSSGDAELGTKKKTRSQKNPEHESKPELESKPKRKSEPERQSKPTDSQPDRGQVSGPPKPPASKSTQPGTDSVVPPARPGSKSKHREPPERDRRKSSSQSKTSRVSDSSSVGKAQTAKSVAPKSGAPKSEKTKADTSQASPPKSDAPNPRPPAAPEATAPANAAPPKTMPSTSVPPSTAQTDAGSTEAAPVGADAPPVPSPPEVHSPPAAAASSSSTGVPKRRRRKKKKSSAPLILGGLGFVALLLVVAVLIYEPDASQPKKTAWRPPPDVIPSVGGGGTVAPNVSSKPDGQVKQTEASPSRYKLIEDDRLLFAPPSGYESDRMPLDLLPPGPAMIVSGRIGRLQQTAGGREMIAALGSELGDLFAAVATRSGVDAEQIDRCTVALHAGKDGWPEVSMAVELTQPKPLAELLQRWNVSASRTPDGVTIYTGDEADGDAYFLGDSEAGKLADGVDVSRFAVGTLDRIREVAEINGGPIPLSRTMETLWKTSSNQADLVALVTPNFLVADGRSMLEAAAPQLSGPLKRFLIPDVASTQLVGVFGDQRTYVELRMIPSGDLTDAALRERLRQTLAAWPTWADDFVVDAIPDTSWRLLANRLPSMMRFLVDHVRDGLSDSTVVVNTYLPTNGVSQLSLATLLALNTPRGVSSAATDTPSVVESLTLPQMLDRKMSVSFEQESLEFAVNTIVDEFQRSLPEGSKLPPVTIVGGDLQLMGITQNQQIRDFKQVDVPLRQVLTNLVLGANPDKTATGPTDPKQALLWVVVKDSDTNGKSEIRITTREAAKGKYELPAEFVTP